MVYHETTEKQSDRNRKKLKCVAARINTSLQFGRNGSPENDIQICIHDRYEHPSDDLTDTP